MEWPLVGRDSIVRRLQATVQRDRSAGAAIVGEAGVGKTRLVAEVTAWAAERGRPVERIVASPAATAVPFGAIAHLLVLPAGTTDQPGLISRLLAELDARRAAAGRLVLAVDDAHHLDDHTAALVHEAAVHGTATVILTTRAGERLNPSLVQLWKDGSVERIEIGPLSRPAAGQLAEQALGGRVESLTMADLWRRTRGNPLFLRELLLAGLESGHLVQENEVWRASGPLTPSDRLSELVRVRLGKLVGRERSVVEALAVAGTLDFSGLEAVGGQGALEALEERRVIQVERSGNRHLARLNHPLYGEVILAELPRTRVRRVMGELADHLERTGGRRHGDLLLQALWRLDGGGRPGAELLLQAAARALAVHDAALGERLARAAMSHGAANVTARLLLGRALAAQQRVDEADEVLRAAGAEARTDDEIARVALARADLLYFRAGRVDDASALLTDASARLKDVDWRDEVESLRVLFRSAAGDLLAVAEAGRRLALRREKARPRAVVHALVFSSIANVMLGRFAEAEDQVRAGLELAPRVRDELPLSPDMLRINGVMAAAYAGSHTSAVDRATAGHRAALDAGAPEVAMMWGMNLAECYLLQGDVESALGTMLGALAVARERDPFGVHGIDASVASVCASWLGRQDLALNLQHEVVELGLARDVRSRIWFDRATVWTTWARDGAEKAARLALDAARRAASDTHLVWAAWLFHDAARLGLPAPAADRLEPLARRIEGGLVPAMALHARALGDGDGIALEQAASAFARLDSRLFAAEAAAAAQQAYLKRGRDRLARVAGARASLLAARCQGVVTPALAGASGVPLTKREHEIAQLAAAGHASREVAGRLGISVRTVDNHLRLVYDKLGVAGRADLPSVLGVTALGGEAGGQRGRDERGA